MQIADTARLTVRRVCEIIFVRQTVTSIRQKKDAMPPRRKSRTITFSLPPEMYQEVQEVKDEEGRDMSELVRESLRLYMDNRELLRQARLEWLRSRQAERQVIERGEIDE